MPRKFLTIDCETDPFQKGRIPKPFIWGVYDGENFETFKDFKDIYDKYQRESVIFYAHNGGKFDYHFIIDFINPYESISIINGRISKMRIGTCEFRDSYCLFPMPLSAYQKDEINYDIMEQSQRDLPVNRTIIFNYLRNDCIYLYHLINSFCESYGVNLTLASAAFKQWRKISGQKNPHTTKDFYSQIKPYYYGGRVQTFHLGEIKETFSVYDINSAYPYAMLHDHPYGSNFNITNKLTYKDPSLDFIELECLSKGQFPFRTPNGLYFPNDKVKRLFQVTGYEFVMADKLGLLDEVKITKVLTFPERINFKQYVNHFFKLKQQAEVYNDKIKRNEAKLFLNGLYGKFAANPENYREYQCVQPRNITACGSEGWQYNSDFGQWALVWKPLGEEKQNYYNVATGASITGFQRAQMMEAINYVERPFYCDTDSLMFNGYNNLKVGSNLGQWKLESECTYGAIAGKKLYCVRQLGGNYKTASKGVRIDHKSIIKIARGEAIKYEAITPTFSINKEPSFLQREITMKKDLQFIN